MTPPDLQAINFSKLTPEVALKTVLANNCTRAGEYVLKVSDTTPQAIIDHLQYSRLEPQYCKVKVKEIAIPRKAILKSPTSDKSK